MAHKVKNSATVNQAVPPELEEPRIAAWRNPSAILAGPECSHVCNVVPLSWHVSCSSWASRQQALSDSLQRCIHPPFVYSQNSTKAAQISLTSTPGRCQISFPGGWPHCLPNITQRRVFSSHALQVNTCCYVIKHSVSAHTGFLTGKKRRHFKICG